MAAVFNLTLPIGTDMRVGSVWPHDKPFAMEPIRTYAAGGAQLEYYEFHTETGTRLMTRARHDADSVGLGGIDFAELVDRRATVVDLPKQANEEISVGEIERAFASVAGYAQGDALLLRTGWCTRQRGREMGDDFVLNSPRLSPQAAERLVGILKQKGTRLLAIDTALLVGSGSAYSRPEWRSLQPWLRPAWPSDGAKAYLRHYSPLKQQADWGGDRIILDHCHVLLALSDASALRTPQVLLTALPFFAEGSPAAPATVVAKEV